MTLLYRRCASAIVFNKKGLILLGNRIDTPEDAWQFSQGGIEEGESPEQAAKRELFEEMSITSVKLISADKEANRYEFPESVKQKFKKKGLTTCGQDIYFCLFYFTGDEGEINTKTAYPEFKSYMWSDFDFAVKNIVDFKKDVYLKAANRFKSVVKQYISHLS